MNQVKYSAPAKVIFSGEHSVVYGEPALISSFDLRLTFTAFLPKKSPKTKDQKISEIINTVKTFLNNKNIEFTDERVDFEIRSSIPQSQGFGSSAALCVASSAALLEYFTGKEWDKSTIYECAYECEKIFHGNPSGADPATSCYGGLVWFRKEFEFLKAINPIPFSVPEEMANNFYLIDSGKRSEQTIDLVVAVKESLEENPALYKKLFRDIGKTTKAMTIGFQENREKLVMDTINRNHKLLDKLGVVGDVASKIIEELNPFGVGKITGAGGLKAGSGFVLFYGIANKHAKLEKYLVDHKLPFIKFQKDASGVVKED
jgi:mevalonate kinase